jgi:hypothetical protein
VPRKKPVIKRIKKDKTIAVDPRQEYLAGGFLPGTSLNDLQTLPPESDIVTREYSPFVYDQMICDPIIFKCINVLKIAILNDGVELVPALPENDEYFDTAMEINDFCNSALRSLEKPLVDTLSQMLDALVYGHKIAEITYKNAEIVGFSGVKLVPDKIKVKELGSVRFVIDNKKNIVGLVGRLAKDIKINGVAAEPLKLTSNDSKVPLINGNPIIPREKFMVLTINPKNDDPRGQSLLRPAFNSWKIKLDIWPEYLRYLLLCATPLLIGFTSDNQELKEYLFDEKGNIVKDSQGRSVEVSPVAALRNALIQARNATCLALPAGSKVEEVGGQGAGTPFYKAIEVLDKQMESSILLQTLATSEGIHQSRAAAQTQMSVLDLLVYGLKRVVVDMLVSDLLRPMVRYNFGNDMLEFVPKVSLGDSERHNWSEDADKVANLYRVGYFQPDQLKAVDAMLGLPLRETVDPQLLIQQLQNAGIPILAIPPPPELEAQVQAGPGGGNTPVPINPSSGLIKTGKRSDSAQQLPSTERTSKSRKFPALGRKKPNINKSPPNEEVVNA